EVGASSRLVLGTQALADSLKNVKSGVDLATALSSTAGTFEPEAIPVSLSVEPVYAQNSGWNDYVKNDEPAKSVYEQDDTACTGAETALDSCIHGGEKRKVVVNGRSTCANLGLVDGLNAFDWTCLVIAGKATFFSKNLKIEKGLRDLVTKAGWKNNKVVLREAGTATAQSTEAVWWSNPVAALPILTSNIILDGVDNDTSGPDTVFAAGTILVFDSNANVGGFNINADRLALVGLQGATLTWAGGSPLNCSSTTGEASGSDRRCLVASGSQKFIWIEGTFDGGNTAQHGVFLHSAAFVGMKFLRVMKAVKSGIVFDQTRNSAGGVILTQNNGEDGIELSGSSKNTFVLAISADNGRDGMRFASNSLDNRLYLSGISNSAQRGIYVLNSTGFLLSLSSVKGSGMSGLELDNSPQARIESSSFQVSALHGLSALNGSQDLTLELVWASGNTQNGFNISAVDELRATGLNAANNGGAGVALTGSADAILVGVVAGFNGGAGLNLASSDTATATFITSVGNGAEGIVITSDTATIVQAVALNNGTAGLDVIGDGTKVSDLAVAHNAIGVKVNSSNNQFIGIFSRGTNGADCMILGGTDPGLNADCSNQGSSTTTPVTGLDLSASFLGKVLVTDSYNSTNTDGAQAYSASMNWTSLSSFLRMWGRDGAAVTSVARGACTSGTCRIWDLRLAGADTRLLERGGDGSTANAPFVNGAACPSYLSGARFVVDQKSAPNTLLRSAFELLHDSDGDDDGLCEIGETCAAAPNLGAYQGESLDSTQSCTFQNGTVTGVTMHSYTVNGK
ncbi:MAG: right-handed parallel beta-helix repeat-containing protein, partial [Bdellovibrionia bacterium]